MLVLLRVLLAVLGLTGPAPARLLALPDTLITAEDAAEHAWSAAVAGALTGERPELLLAISWHESRYVSNVTTAEPGGRVSCGVMTPVPVAHCDREPLAVQYLRGATHLATWRRYLGARALFGYAGGFGLERECRAGSDLRQCAFPNEMEALARWIATANAEAR